MKKSIKAVFAILPLFASISACGKSANTVVFGTMANPGEPIIEHFKSAFEAEGYTLEIKVFTDFATPNAALADGSIDINLFQHEPFLKKYNSANNTDLFCAAKLYDCIYGGYTKKGYTSLDQLPEGSTITVANDASNFTRCLNILAAAKLIELNDLSNVSSTITSDDVNSYIKTNAKNFVVKPMSTSLIAASLDNSEVSLGLVNATFAIAAGLTSSQLLVQEQDSEHVNANILATRSEDKTSQWAKDLVKLLTSDDSAAFIKSQFNGVLTPYFIDNVNVA